MNIEEINAVLASLYPRGADSPEGYISAADLQESLLKLMGLVERDIQQAAVQASAYGSYVRIAETELQWTALKSEAVGKTIPYGCIALVKMSADPASDGDTIYAWDGTQWIVLTGSTGGGSGSGVTDHGYLTGLADNDHPQYQLGSQKGQANGYASLASDGKVPAGQLPASTGGGGESGGEATPAVSRFVPVVIINGESNSGGYALNSEALPSELLPRPAVQIFDNIGLSSFQTLDIGTNNLIDHAGLDSYATTCHGLELALANSVEAGQWWDDTVYLIKTGQGGSQISQWNVGGAYYTKFLDRTRNGLALLRAQGKIPVVYFWYSLGINDAIAGTNEATWKTNVESYFDRVRAEIGYVPIFSTQFMSVSPGFAFNDSVVAMAASDNMVYAIDAANTTTRDQNHWDYAGMKLMGERMVAATLQFGQHEGYILKSISMMAGGTPMTPPADKPNIVRTPATVTFVEGSSGGPFTVALSKAPVANVVVTVSASGGNVTPSPTTLTFTTSNWATAQTVTCTSPNDNGQNGSRSSTVSLFSIGVSASATVGVTVTDAFVNPGPINSVIPAITGATTLASVVTCSQGTWSGSPTGYTYQWRRDALDIAGQTTNTHTIVVADQGHVLTCMVSATNALGTNSATSANLTVPADTGNYVPVVWKEMSNAVDDGSGMLRATAGGDCGGNATTTIDATKPFSVLVEWGTQADSVACVFMLDEAASTIWGWGAGQTFATAAYHNNGAFSAINDSATLPWPAYTPTFPLKVKGTKSGNDVIWSTSTDGTAWTDRYTHVNALVGKTTLYPRMLIALASAGKKAKASIDVTTGTAPTVPANTVVPAISGPTDIGSVLTASTGTWTGTPSAYAYQWKKNGTNIAAATTNQYTVVAGDQGNNISVSVTASNAQGSATATSANTAIPMPAAPVNSVLPAITGSTSLGGVLTCSTGTWSGSPTGYAYQWKRDGTNIAGQTASTHTVVAADQTHTLSCAVSATNALGTTTATSAGTGIADTGQYTPFAWKGFANSSEVSQELVSNGSMPGGANSVLTWNAQEPWQIMGEFASSAMAWGVVVHIEDTIDFTNFTWGGSQAFVSGLYHTQNTGGTPRLFWSDNGTTNTELVGYTPTWPLKYRAQKVGNDIVWSTSPDGTTWTTRYTDTNRLVGKTTLQARILFAIAANGQKVKVSHDLVTGTNPTAPVNSTLPVVTGSTALGGVLTTTTGVWTQSPTGYTYQWKRNGSSISGQTASTHTIVSADYNTDLTVTVTATNALGSTSATSAATNVPTPAAPANTALPTISGSVALGGVLTCTTGTWTQNPTGYTYQWKRDTVSISGETANTHTIVAADQTHSLTCMVTATNPTGSTSATTAASAVPAASTLVPFTYQNITNASVDGNGYVVASGAAAGANMVEVVDVSQPFALIIDWDSAALANATVVMLDDNRETSFGWTSPPQDFITGCYETGGATYCGINASTPLTWGWAPTFPCKIKMEKSGNDVKYSSSPDGSTWTQRYVHTGVLSGKTVLYPRILFAVGSAGQKVKVLTDSALLSPTAPVNIGLPTITGTPSVGQLLTCSTGTWTQSPTSYAYQWYRNTSELISGATANTYTLVAADEGGAVVCRVTATNALGSANAFSTGVPISAAGLVWNSVTWGSRSSASVVDAGNGKVTLTDGAAGQSAVADDYVSFDQPWELEVTFESSGVSNGVVIMLDNASGFENSWGSSDFVIGTYHYNTALQSAKSGSSVTPIGTSMSGWPVKIKMVKVGNDVAFYRAEGAAAYGVPFYTEVGVLAGVTGQGYIKALWAVPGVNQSQTVRVAYLPGL